ncbi:MAG TPA: ATP-binding protein [Anaerolineae bacterium]|nr:ATP-binding protein [Anaerolineae bacterium]HQH38216.1 ATP-binding protein [Anaerolineae bacterium]
MKLKRLNRLLTVPSVDPEDARRRKLLNIILAGMTFLVLAALIGVSLIHILGYQGKVTNIYLAIITGLVSFLLIYLINRYGSGWIASTLFLLLLTAILALVDDPRQVVEGRSLFLFTIPILMASVIIRPWASFIAAGICGLAITIVAMFNLPDYAQGAPPIPTILGFFTVAFVAWLSARSLENALADLRALNAELENRVRERTQELQKANAELTLAYEKLQELDRFKSRFLSIVSHELRTPLNAIQGFVEMLQTEVYGPISPRQSNALNRVIANAERLLSLVNDLLDQAQIEAGRFPLIMEPFVLQDLVNDMESTMRVLVESKKLYLNVHISPAVPATLQGDRKRIHQILVNLINNALKFTQQGGIDVHFYRPDEEYWAIDVTDTGPGITKEIQTLIFEPFQQADNSATREHAGFGLGLSIVKQLATLMGGSVSVTSEIGVGSTFTVKIPIVPPQKITNTQHKAGGVG